MKRTERLAALAVSVTVSALFSIGLVSPVGAQGLPYPVVTPFQLKGIGIETRDAWQYSHVLSHEPGGIVTNLPWNHYQGTRLFAPCPASTPDTTWVAFEGFCYSAPKATEDLIKTFSDANVRVTGILLFPPDWAALNCEKPYKFLCGTHPFWAPDFGRFARFIAWRYNGQNGVGRVIHYVIHNEVNSPWAYYSDGCGQPGYGACTISGQVARYADDWNRAYDGIKSHQAAAKVFVSLTNRFSGADNPNPPGPGQPPVPGITIQTYLTQFASYVGARQWQLAVHAYPMSDVSPVFSPNDPDITPGAIGKLAGWLRRQFPSTPSAWEVYLTENGLHGNDADTGYQQSLWLCEAFRNVVGTPGVEGYLYTPLTSHLGFGSSKPELISCLLDGNGNCTPGTDQARWSWATWALANRPSIGQVSCGFEHLPYTKLSRYHHPNRGHLATTRLAPAGSNFEVAWKLLRAQDPGTHPLYECEANSGSNYTGGGHTFVDRSYTCAGFLTPMGPLGYAWDNPGPGLLPLNRCYVSAPGWEDHFLSTNMSCDGWIFEETLGYVLPF
jgi:hypothetical protein